MVKTQTQASGLRIVMMVVVILGLIPLTIGFGLFGFIGGLFALLLVAFAEKDKTTL